jgi:hypothetical protein
MGEHDGVLKHVAGAIMHEPVPYSTRSHHPIQATQAKRAKCWQPRHNDESQTRPRLPTF